MYTALTPPDGTHAIIFCGSGNEIECGGGISHRQGRSPARTASGDTIRDERRRRRHFASFAHFVRTLRKIGPMFIGQPIPSYT